MGAFSCHLCGHPAAYFSHTIAGMFEHDAVCPARLPSKQKAAMSKQVMICGVDCHQGDANCNGYCTGKTDSPPAATEAQKIAAAKTAAHKAADAAEKAWYELAGLLDVGPERTEAFQVYENLRHSRRRGACVS